MRNLATGTWKMMALCGVILLGSGGCESPLAVNHGRESEAPAGQRASMVVANTKAHSYIRVYKQQDKRVWVPLAAVVHAMDLEIHTDADKDSYLIGNTDPKYRLTINNPRAVTGDHKLLLTEAPQRFDQQPYITTQSLAVLLGTPVRWDEAHSQVIIHPLRSQNPSNQQTNYESRNETGELHSLTTAEPVNVDALITYGKQYLGIPYEFGADEYDKSHTFDCSSFVQHVFAHFDVDLPRSSLAQSETGQSVQKDELKPGDLMFFYTPGRYDSNQTVGHVGIYVGEDKILQTYGAPGVEISEFNDYWKKRFLFAKRVL